MKMGRWVLVCAWLAAAVGCGRGTMGPGPTLGLTPGTEAATATFTAQATTAPYPTVSPVPAVTPYLPPLPTQPTAPTEPRLNQILDFWFVDELHGWLTASICGPEGGCKLGMRATLNGGVDWDPLPAPEAPISFFGTDQAGGVHSVRFQDEAVGWVYGPALYATTDGGQSWREEKLAGDVLDIELPEQGETAWALVSECGGKGDCALKVYAPAGKGGWQALAVQPGLSGRSGRLFRIATNREASGQIHQGEAFQYSWVVGQTGTAEGGISTWGLAFSADGGATWARRTIPCETLPDLPLLSVAEPQILWLVCAGGPGAGNQMKSLYLSEDGGQSWERQADPIWSGYADALAALSSKRAFFGLGRGTLLSTTDGGKDWNAAIPDEIANPGEASGWVIRFYQGAYGWAALGDRFFRTTTAGEIWKDEIKG